MGGALLEFGPDEDPSQGYRVRVRTASGMDAVVWLDTAQQSRLAESAMIHKEQALEQQAATGITATVRHRCQFCREPVSRWRWWLRGAVCGTCGVRVGMGGAPRIRR